MPLNQVVENIKYMEKLALDGVIEQVKRDVDELIEDEIFQIVYDSIYLEICFIIRDLVWSMPSEEEKNQ